MKNIIVKIVTLIAVGVPEGLIIDYLKSENMTEIMWLTIFGAALLLVFLWAFWYLINKIDKQNEIVIDSNNNLRYLLIKFHELSVAEQNYMVNSLKTHFVEMDNAVNTLFDAINEVSSHIVKENLLNPNLEPPIATPKVKTDEKVKILAEQARIDLQKLRDEFNIALNN